VFISWSGELSRDVAATIRDEFPNVLQGLEVFMSQVDIESGAPWFETIETNLADSSYGIIIVTRENQGRPWLLFEAGALAKKTNKSQVTPLLVDLTNIDLIGSLSQFQATRIKRDEFRKLLAELNNSREQGQRLPEGNFDRTFEKWWTDLESKLRAATERHAAAGAPSAARSTHDLVAEVLTEVRKLSRQLEIVATNPADVAAWLPRISPSETALGQSASVLLPLRAGMPDPKQNKTVYTSTNRAIVDLVRALRVISDEAAEAEHREIMRAPKPDEKPDKK
jgi:hypothetical protein